MHEAKSTKVKPTVSYEVYGEYKGPYSHSSFGQGVAR